MLEQLITLARLGVQKKTIVIIFVWVRWMRLCAYSVRQHYSSYWRHDFFLCVNIKQKPHFYHTKLNTEVSSIAERSSARSYAEIFSRMHQRVVCIKRTHQKQEYSSSCDGLRSYTILLLGGPGVEVEKSVKTGNLMNLRQKKYFLKEGYSE